MVQTMKFLIVEPSPLPILIPLGPKYSPLDPVFKYPLPDNRLTKTILNYKREGKRNIERPQTR